MLCSCVDHRNRMSRSIILVVVILILSIISIYSYSIRKYNKLALKPSYLYNSKLNNDQSSTLMISSDNDDDMFQEKLRKWFLLNYNVRPEIYLHLLKIFLH